MACLPRSMFVMEVRDKPTSLPKSAWESLVPRRFMARIRPNARWMDCLSGKTVVLYFPCGIMSIQSYYYESYQ